MMKPSPCGLTVTILPMIEEKIVLPDSSSILGVMFVRSVEVDQEIELAESQKPNLPLALKIPICPVILRNVGTKDVRTPALEYLYTSLFPALYI